MFGKGIYLAFGLVLAFSMPSFAQAAPIRTKCMKSQTQAISRIVPLDVQSAQQLNWQGPPLASGTFRIQIAPDIPDNRNQTPNQFRLAYFYSSDTIARYTNSVDHQASIEFVGPPQVCGATK